MKVLVVGLNPSRKLGKSPSITTLHGWLEVLGLKTVSFQNMYEDYDASEINKKICLIKKLAPEYDKIIALGSTVSKELQHEDIPHFALPHPSPLNRQLNDPAFVQYQLTKCKQYLES